MFNKFHGIVCAVRFFVHGYHMAGRVSEECSKLFNRGMDKEMNYLASIPVMAGRVELVSAQIQGNLKTDTLEKKIGMTETYTVNM